MKAGRRVCGAGRGAQCEVRTVHDASMRHASSGAASSYMASWSAAPTSARPPAAAVLRRGEQTMQRAPRASAARRSADSAHEPRR
eukprot:6324506-Prymnesium_polylepis.1